MGKDQPIGSQHYRAFVGPPEKYDIVSAMQFNLLTLLGLREDHRLLDIGCGSLRGGKLLLVYLLPEMYCGVEPEKWLVEEGIKNELGREIVEMKQPRFNHDRDFNLSSFGVEFDFLLAQSIFSHASEAQIKKCMAEARKVMKPDALFAATFMGGEENYKGDEWVYPGCATYTLEHFTALVEGQGLCCEPLNWAHPNDQTWVVIYNKEHGENLKDIEVSGTRLVGPRDGVKPKKGFRALFRR